MLENVLFSIFRKYCFFGCVNIDFHSLFRERCFFLICVKNILLLVFCNLFSLKFSLFRISVFKIDTLPWSCRCFLLNTLPNVVIYRLYKLVISNNILFRNSQSISYYLSRILHVCKLLRKISM